MFCIWYCDYYITNYRMTKKLLLYIFFYCFQTHTIFVDAFLQNNRLDHVSQVMGYHPSYLDHFLKTQSFILRGDGPLPYDYRHYIAIMVSMSRYIVFQFILTCRNSSVSVRSYSITSIAYYLNILHYHIFGDNAREKLSNCTLHFGWNE